MGSSENMQQRLWPTIAWFHQPPCVRYYDNKEEAVSLSVGRPFGGSGKLCLFHQESGFPNGLVGLLNVGFMLGGGDVISARDGEEVTEEFVHF